MCEWEGVYTRARHTGIRELGIECSHVTISQQSIEQILILELVVECHMVNEVPIVEVLT